MIDVLAAFEADLEDLEEGPDLEEEPADADLGATHDLNQERVALVGRQSAWNARI
jgi:hypothetical protein